MKRLISKVVLFIIPIFCWFLFEGFLPSNTFTYRPWEALKFQTIFGYRKVFHPSVSIQMNSGGELCHHTNNSLYKNEIWETDKLGNRNNTFIEAPDIIIVGDSFVAGERITQDSTITNLLQVELGDQIKVYSFTPASLSYLEYYLKSNFIKKPKLVIFSCGEQYLPPQITKYVNAKSNSLKYKIKIKLMNNVKVARFCIFMDKLLRMYSLNWAKARLTNQIGEGVPGIEGSNMYFLKGASMEYPFDHLETVKKTIISYKEYCDSINCDFLFLPMPNKETVYYDFVPFKQQPNYLLKLDTILKENNVKTINTLQLYNDYRKCNTELLYQLDDTHWNPNAIQLISKEIAKTIKQDLQYLVQN